jgi:putative ABC transport system ATP-binding protein
VGNRKSAQQQPPLIQIKDLRYRWQAGDNDVIAIESLEVAAGERVFIEGPSGSGKTTLLNLLAGVLKPSAGTLSVLGADLMTLTGTKRDQFRSDHIGFVFQSFNLLPYLSLLENVLLACRFSRKRQERIAAANVTPADEAARLLAHLGLDHQTLARRGVHQLSTGQQQRVAVARALIGRPELVICDEPTSALDADARATFLTLLSAETHAAGATLVFVSHDRSLASGFDRSISLNAVNDGKGSGQ